jgi:hypothetical protein
MIHAKPLLCVLIVGIGAGCAPALDQDAVAQNLEQQSPQTQEDSPMTEVDWNNAFDPDLAVQAGAVLRVRLISPGIGSKFVWDEVEVLGVIKNASDFRFGNTLKVAHYSWEPGVPEGESTIYLVPYSEAPDHLWKLLGDSAARGVSHTSAKPS